MMAREQPAYNRLVNRRECPGSYATVSLDVNDWGVCPFCRRSFSGKRGAGDTGTLRAHPRPR